MQALFDTRQALASRDTKIARLESNLAKLQLQPPPASVPAPSHHAASLPSPAPKLSSTPPSLRDSHPELDSGGAARWAPPSYKPDVVTPTRQTQASAVPPIAMIEVCRCPSLPLHPVSSRDGRVATQRIEGSWQQAPEMRGIRALHG